MKNKSKLRSVLSWADEVEKEEQEVAAECESHKQKTNPFGSAKPREVVLQERGIDWRYLDQHLHISSSSLRGTPEQVRQGRHGKLVQYRRGLGEDVPGPSYSESVPPLKYPPKAYVNGVYIQNYVHSSFPLQTWQLDVQRPTHDYRNDKGLQKLSAHWSHQGSRTYQEIVGGRSMDAKMDLNGQQIETPRNYSKFGKQFTNQDSHNCVERRQSKGQLKKIEAARGEFRGNKKLLVNHSSAQRLRLGVKRKRLRITSKEW